MSNVLIGYSNRGDAATLTDGSWDATYVLNNLKDGNISLPARTANILPSSTRFRFDLTATYALRALDFAHHTLSESAFWRARIGTAPFDVDFSQGTGDSRITATGGANGTVFNENGNLVAASAPRYDYDRMDYVNGFLQSEDMTAGFSYSTYTRALDSRTVMFGSSSTMLMLQFSLDLAVDTYTVSGWTRLVSGSGALFPFVNNPTNGNVFGTTITATSKWTYFKVSIANATATSGGAAGFQAAADGVIQFKQLQLQRGTGTKPYRKTTTSRIYACRGARIETAATNIALQSSVFGVTWVPAAATVTSNNLVGIDGTASGDTLTATAATAVHLIQQTMTVTASLPYTAQFVVKQNTGNATHVQVAYDNGTTNGAFINVRLSDGVITAGPTGYGTSSNIKGGCTPLGGGWFHVWVTAQQAATTGRILAIMLNTANAAAGFAPSIAMTTGDSIGLSFGQLVQSDVPSSFIPTTTVAVTRSTDSLTVSGTNLTAWLVQGSGTLYTEFCPAADGPLSDFNMGAVLSDGTVNNWIGLFSQTSNDQVLGQVQVGGVGQFSGTTSPATTIPYNGTFTRAAISYNASSVKMAANGNLSVLNTTATIPSAITQLAIGAEAGFNQTGGWVRRVTWWPPQLTDAQMTALTSLTGAGPGAVDYDSGWLNALQFGFAQDDIPSDWGKRGYNLMTAFDARGARYGTIEIMDPNNASATLDLGRLYVSGGLQPAIGAQYEGYENTRAALDTPVESENGKKFWTARRRKKTTAINFGVLSLDEANTVDELSDFAGLAGEVLFVPDPTDMAASQRFGGLGLLSKMSPLAYPYFKNRATSFQFEEKL